MAFKKVSQEEIKYALYNSLIGVPLAEGPGMVKDKEKIRKKIRGTGEKLRSLGMETAAIRHTKSSIVANFIKEEIIVQDHTGSIKEFNKKQYLNIENRGQMSRIWNVSFSLDDNGESYKIGEILPGNKWSANISEDSHIKDIENPISIKEFISKKGYVESEDGEDLFLEPGHENTVYIKLSVFNSSGKPVYNLQITKMIPYKSEILEIKTDSGSITKSNRFINWTIESVGSGMRISLFLKLRVPAERISTGEIIARYSTVYQEEDIPIKINNFRCSVKTASFLNINELDDKPNHWDCSLDIMNLSEFDIKIPSVSVYREDGDKKEPIFRNENPLFIPAYGERKIFEQIIPSETEPALQKHVEMTPEIILGGKYLCSISIEPKTFEILDVLARSWADPSTIPSYVESRITQYMEFVNHSSVPVNHLLLYLDYPEFFAVENFGEIVFQAGDVSKRLSDFGKDVISEDPEKRLKEINSILMGLYEEIEKIKGQKQDLEGELEEEVRSINSVDLKDLDKKDHDIRELLDKDEKEFHSIEVKLKNLEKEIDDRMKKQHEMEDDIKKLEDQRNALELLEKKRKALDDISKSVEKITQEIEQNESRIKKLQSEITSQKEKIESLPEEERSKAHKELDKKSKELDGVIKAKEKRENELKSLKRQKEALLSEIKKSEKDISVKNMDKARKLLEESRARLDESNKRLNELKKQLEDIKEEKASIQRKVKDLKDELDKIEKLKKDRSGKEKKISELKEKLKSITAELEKKVSEISALELQKRKYSIISNAASSHEQMISYLMDSFKNIIAGSDEDEQSSAKSGVELISMQSDSNRNKVFLRLNGFDKILRMIDSDNKFLLSIPIKANKPRHDRQYSFNVELFYETEPRGGIRTYNFGPESLPKISIQHERRKISLGKIVDHFEETDMFQITIIIRNFGTKLIKKLEIVDKLPESAEISNASHKYELGGSEDGIQNIVWSISSLAPKEETEITYLVKLKDPNIDLNDFNIKFR